MHTFKRSGKASEFEVGSIEREQYGDVFVPMFRGLSLPTALRLVSLLNGGTGEISTGLPSSQTLQACLVKEQ